MAMGDGLGRAPRATRALLLLWLVGGVAACGDDGKKETPAGSSAALSGRVFSADTGKPLAGAQVMAPDGTKSTSDAEGAFQVSYDSERSGPVRASGANHAPVEKPSPKGDGYVELFAKGYDAQQQIETDKAADVHAPSGARIKLEAGTLKNQQTNTDGPKTAQVSIAAPDPRKSGELGSLPGNFDAEQDGKRGKVSADSPVYVAADAEDAQLVLMGKAGLDLPVRSKGSQKAANGTLYRFDPATGLWVAVSEVTSALNPEGVEVFKGEIDQLGWWTVGSFYDQLSCLRACVVDANDQPVPRARGIVSGVEDFTQSVGYTGDDGCFAVDVRADVPLIVSAQTAAGFVEPRQVHSGTGGSASDPDSCLTLERKLVLTPRDEDFECPSGYSLCGDACVDLSSDAAHCGACDNACELSACVVGECTTVGVDEPDAGAGQDSGVPSDGEPDSGRPIAMMPDGGVRPMPPDGGPGTGRVDAAQPDEVDASDMPPGKDASTGLPDSGRDTGANDAGIDMCAPPICISEYAGPMIGTLQACCADGTTCGSAANQLYSFGFDPADPCLARDQPGAYYAGCEPMYRSGTMGIVQANGCCQPNGECGLDMNNLNVQTDAGVVGVSFGLGCVSLPELGLGGPGASCPGSDAGPVSDGGPVGADNDAAIITH